jgi:hypothetical protein
MALRTILELELAVDPRELQVNRRYRDNHALTPEVRAAMQTIQGQVFDAVHEQPDFRLAGTYELALRFSFLTMASDIDGPVKRTIDAIALGINMALTYRGRVFNDNEICVLHVSKSLGKPGMSLTLRGDEEERCLRS